MKRRKRETYKVQTGDNWFTIAEKKKRKARQLARANRGVETLRPGQVITIPEDFDVPLRDRTRAPRPPQPAEIRKAGDRYQYDPASVQAGRAPAIGIDWDAVRATAEGVYDVQRIQGEVGQVPVSPYFPETVPTEIGLKFGKTTLPADMFPNLQPGAPTQTLPGIPQTDLSGLRGAGTYYGGVAAQAVGGAYNALQEAIANRPTGLESIPRTDWTDQIGAGRRRPGVIPGTPQAPLAVREGFGQQPQGEVPYSPEYIDYQSRLDAQPTNIAGVPAGEIDSPERAARTSPSMWLNMITAMIDNGYVPTRLTNEQAALLGMTEQDLLDAGYVFDGEHWIRSAYTNTPTPNGRGEPSGYGYTPRGGGGGGGGYTPPTPQSGRMVGGRPGGSQSPLPPGVFGLVSWSGV